MRKFKLIMIGLLFSGCTAYEVTMHPNGKVKEVDGDRALVEFQTSKIGNYGAAWFFIPGAKKGEILKLKKK